MRIFAAGIATETNTFAPLPTGRALRGCSTVKSFTATTILTFAALTADAQLVIASFDAVTKVFRLDGGNVSYVFVKSRSLQC